MDESSASRRPSRPWHVGVVGLGHIGSALAMNLAAAGFHLTVRDIRAEAMEAISALSARATASPAEVAERSTVVMTSLPHPDVSRSVYLGEQGLLSTAQGATTLVECSTLPPRVSIELSEACRRAGIGYLEAAVVGGVQAVREGRATLFVGGTNDTFAQVRPVLEAVSPNVIHAGPVGVAMTAKVVNNAVSHANMAVLCEAIAIGVKAGVAPVLLLQILQAGTGDSYQVRSRFAERILKANYDDGASIDIVAKDSEFVLELARAAGVNADVLASADRAFQTAVSLGLGDLDYAALILPWERLLGIRVSGTGDGADQVSG